MPKGIEIRDAHFPGRPPIDSYGNSGFRFADMSHRGSILCLPSGVHGWRISEFSQITADAFAAVLEESNDIEILLVGCGTDIARLPADVRQILREAGIGVEVMNTSSAVRTYNVLLSEDRAVAAALIAVDNAGERP